MPAAPDAVPISLFHTGRAQCPDCGAPLTLMDARPQVACQYCGCAAAVERRLRTFEPSLADGFITADAPPDSARAVRPSHVIPAVAQDESHCPTCGAEVAEPPAGDTLQALRTCPHCGTESKVERRLARRAQSADEALEALERQASEYDRRQFTRVVRLYDAVANGELPLQDRVKAAQELGNDWLLVNAAAARQLPKLLAALRDCRDPRLEIPASQIIGKLLCAGDKRLANAVLRAAEQFTFDPIHGSRALLLQLGLGDPIGLKLLLDTADHAATRGHTVYAATALWAVNQMFERHYADRLRLAEIVLYRLLYLRGPVQAWAIQLAQGQLGLGVRFPTPTVLRFIDDCAAERPELLPCVHKFFYTGAAETEADWLARLVFMDQLISAKARSAALTQLGPPPDSASDKAVGGVFERLLSLGHHPDLGPSAVAAICEIIENGMRPRPPIPDFIAAHGDALPEDVRRAYLRRVPDCKLFTEPPRDYWQPQRDPPKSAFDLQLDQWHQMWDTGIRQAVEEHRARQTLASTYGLEVRCAGG